MLKKFIVSVTLFVAVASLANDNFRYRKYLHVKNFYQSIAKEAIELSYQYNVPPAAVLAIAGVESGYARGYVSQITGNILSLGAKKGEAELPALYLPNLKKDSSKILFSEKIKKYKSDELVWKKRPASLKKDYRPRIIAGTPNQLDYFNHHPNQRKAARLACIKDFVESWINRNRRYKPFVDARIMLDKAVQEGSKKVLFDRELNIKFLEMISGKKNSFNYRKSWAPKVIKIMDNAGLIELSKFLHVEKKRFNEVW